MALRSGQRHGQKQGLRIVVVTDHNQGSDILLLMHRDTPKTVYRENGITPVQSRRNKKAAIELKRRLLKKQGFVPDAIVADKLTSYGAAPKGPGLARHHGSGSRKNNRARELSLVSPTAATTNAALQFGSISAAASLYPHLQRPTPSDLPKSIAPVSQLRSGPVANRHRFALKPSISGRSTVPGFLYQ